MLQDTVIQIYQSFKTVPTDKIYEVVFESMNKLIKENPNQKQEIINLFCEQINSH